MIAIDLRKLLNIPEELDKRSTDALIRAIKENHISEFDYLKFMHSVQTLQGMDIDEATAYKSAFTTSKTMGFTKENFRKSLRHYMSILSNQRESFAEALKRQRAEKLTGQTEKNKKIIEKIAAHKEKIAKLQEEIKILESRIENSDDRIIKEREKLENITTNFVNSYNFIEKEMKTHLALFEQHT